MSTITSAAAAAKLVTVRLALAPGQWDAEIHGLQRTRFPVCSRDEAPVEPPTDTAATLLLNMYGVLVTEGAIWTCRAPGVWETCARRI
ncbi:hypothetical protein ACIBBE_24645 [Streptomyces sp. NPDC051644]|uniref:hypothetical protein n=1 Tax=Streptomyces sp. NPDC051644 TaxID=3365666 RepID=UPI0037BAEA50